ncbi:MAG: GNAT family N-acetyltransferase [Candidatus Glassbacteria bacterium]
MSIRVKLYDNEYEKRWKDLLARAHNATIFHDLKFLSYHPDSKFKTSHLLFFRNDRLISAMPAAILERSGKDVLASPYGASWGGLLLPGNLGVEDVHEIVEAMIRFAVKSSIGGIEITLPPIVYLQRQDQVQEYCLLASGFRMSKGEVTEIIYLPGFSESALKSSYRRAVGKANRCGVRVKPSQQFGPFHEILCADRAEKKVLPTHSLADLERIHLLLPDRIRLFTAVIDGEIVGGTLLFVAARKTVLNMYLCQLAEGRSARVANILMYESACWARDAGFTYYDLGTSSIEMVPNWGLTRFKEGFLARGYVRPTYVLHIAEASNG